MSQQTSCAICFLVSLLFQYVFSQKRILGEEDHADVAQHLRYNVYSCVLGDKGLCTGGVINLKYVLTAAHCVKKPGTLGEYLLRPSEMYCDYGPREELLRRSKRVIRHPRFIEGRIGGHDIALIEVDRPWFNFRYILRFDPEPWTAASRQCFVVGWGMDPTTNMFWEPKRRLNLTAIHECKRMPDYTKRRLICGVREPWKGICFGDGGGILTCGKEMLAVGLVSMIVPTLNHEKPLHFYDTCGHPDYQDAYTFLCPYYGWIKQVVPDVPIIFPQGCSGAKSRVSYLLLSAILFLVKEFSRFFETFSSSICRAVCFHYYYVGCHVIRSRRNAAIEQ